MHFLFIQVIFFSTMFVYFPSNLCTNSSAGQSIIFYLVVTLVFLRIIWKNIRSHADGIQNALTIPHISIKVSDWMINIPSISNLYRFFSRVLGFLMTNFYINRVSFCGFFNVFFASYSLTFLCYVILYRQHFYRLKVVNQRFIYVLFCL